MVEHARQINAFAGTVLHIRTAVGRIHMQKVPLGTKGSFSILVGREHLASQFKDSILPPVFATPMMILAMENAALNAVRPSASGRQPTCIRSDRARTGLPARKLPDGSCFSNAFT